MVSELQAGKGLHEWFIERDIDNFPAKENYPQRYLNIKDYLDRNVYANISTGALLAAIKAGEKPIIINDHGIKHIEKVIEILTSLMCALDYEISPYEAYILLSAVSIHDAAIVYGRSGHENRCREIMDNLSKIAGEDTFEKRAILSIASAHGGRIKDNKDTITRLPKESMILNQKVRKQALAALLRFADELADDRSRASRFMFNNKLLEGSEIYHAYSYALHTVYISKYEINLHFEMTKDRAMTKLKKNGGDSYLLDEIIERLLKMHIERLYCMRFIKSANIIDKINSKVEIYDTLGQDHIIDEPLVVLPFIIEETGYPDNSESIIRQNLYSCCGYTGQTLMEFLSH